MSEPLLFLSPRSLILSSSKDERLQAHTGVVQ